MATVPRAPRRDTFGTGTAELVKAFQRDRDLGQSGVLDAGTLLAADQALAIKAPVPIAFKGRPGRQAVTPPAHSAGRRTPPIAKPDAYPIYFEDGYYMTGTEDPDVVPDSGAGAWNSKPKTFSAIALAEAISTALKGGAGMVAGYHATLHLKHYLGNSGLDYRIDLEDMVRTVPSAKDLMLKVHGLLRAFLSDLPTGRYDFTMREAQNGANGQGESSDWYFAIGSYAAWGKGRAAVDATGAIRKYDVDFSYRFFDRYNWDQGKSVTLAGITITDEFMGEFHRQGLAREFNCVGALGRRLIWAGSQAPSSTLILQKGGR